MTKLEFIQVNGWFLRLLNLLPQGCLYFSMTPTISDYRSDLSIVVEFFCTDESVKELPFMHSFPRNCCEVVSAILAGVFVSRYNELGVECACGQDLQKMSKHFWVEVDKHVIDATAHQFCEISGPLVCKAPSPLEKRFPDVEKVHPEEAIAELSSLNISAEWRKTIIERLACKFAANLPRNKV